MPQNQRDTARDDVSIAVPIPAPDADLYSRKATDDVLLYLSRYSFEAFTAPELANHIDFSAETIRRAADVLHDNDLLRRTHDGNKVRFSINRERLRSSDNPYLQIPQQEYQKPVRRATERLTEALDDVVGVVLYGSVARGEADRQSDIDLWVVVRGDRAPNQRTANEIANELGNEPIDGERYSYHIAVESLSAIPSFTDEISEIVLSGIPVYRTDAFGKLRNLIAHGGDADEL